MVEIKAVSQKIRLMHHPMTMNDSTVWISLDRMLRLKFCPETNRRYLRFVKGGGNGFTFSLIATNSREDITD